MARAGRDALQSSHRDVFRKLVSLSLESLVTELEAMSGPRTKRHMSDSCLAGYWSLIGLRCRWERIPRWFQLFLSNIRLALEVLRLRQEQGQASRPTSSPQPLLDR